MAFLSLTESIDTSTPGGKLVFHVFGALAEFERELIRERTMAGLAAARARGRSGGRPTVWTPEKLQVAPSAGTEERRGAHFLKHWPAPPRPEGREEPASSIFRAFMGRFVVAE